MACATAGSRARRTCGWIERAATSRKFPLSLWGRNPDCAEALRIAQRESGRCLPGFDLREHIVIMLKGWARFMYEDKNTLVSAGDCVHQRPGIVHYLFDYSPDMEYLEIVGPADFKTVEVPGPCAVPEPAPWAATVTALRA